MQFFVKRILTYTHSLLTMLDTLMIGVFPVISRDYVEDKRPGYAENGPDRSYVYSSDQDRSLHPIDCNTD